MNFRGRIFYGWWIVAAGFFFMYAGIGIFTNTYGVLFRGIIQDTGFSRGGLGLYFTLLSLSIVASSAFMGRLLVRFNIRFMMAICLTVSGLLFMSFSQATKLWHFYILAVILGLFVTGCSTLPSSILITNWFKEKRGTAIGIAFTGSGIGGMISNPLAQYIITNYGWRTAYIVLGIIFMAITLPFVLLVIRFHPAEKGLKPLGEEGGPDDSHKSSSMHGLKSGEVSGRAVFWLLGLALFLVDLLIIGVQNNIPIFLKDLGHSASFAASIMALYMGVLVFGKMVLGAILDRFGAKSGITFILLMFIVAMFAFINGRSVYMVILFATALAMATPIATVYPSFITGHLFGNIDYGPIYGIQNIFLNLGMACAMPLTGAAFDRTGTLIPVWYLFILLAVILLLLFYYILSLQPALQRQWHER